MALGKPPVTNHNTMAQFFSKVVKLTAEALAALKDSSISKSGSSPLAKCGEWEITSLEEGVEMSGGFLKEPKQVLTIGLSQGAIHTNLHPTTIIKEYHDSEANLLHCGGKIGDAINASIVGTSTYDEFLAALKPLLGESKTLVLTRRNFFAKNRNGETYPTYCLDINVK